MWWYGVRGLFASVLLTITVVACSDDKRKVMMSDIAGDAWDSVEEFYYDNSDTLQLREIAICLRYDHGCVADSMVVDVLTLSPDKLLFEEPFTLHIPHLSDMRPEEQTFVYRRNVTLSKEGRYMFRLTPHNPVEGISSVGVIISAQQ